MAIFGNQGLFSLIGIWRREGLKLPTRQPRRGRSGLRSNSPVLSRGIEIQRVWRQPVTLPSSGTECGDRPHSYGSLFALLLQRNLVALIIKKLDRFDLLLQVISDGGFHLGPAGNRLNRGPDDFP